MIIREFTVDLIDGVCELQNACFPDGWNKEMMLSAFKEGRYFGFCAFEDEKLVGFIACTLGLDVCDLEGVAVLQNYRGKGVAKTLINKADEVVKGSTADGFMLEVRESNAPAIRLYERCAFKRIAVRKRYYSDGESAVIMRKEIVK